MEGERLLKTDRKTYIEYRAAETYRKTVLFVISVFLFISACIAGYTLLYITSFENRHTSHYELYRDQWMKGCAGWLTIDGTNIDYPVMQGKDNFRYLGINPLGQSDSAGSIFMDSACDPMAKDSYTLIYGHHMDGNAMFGSLPKFADAKYLALHRTGTYKTSDRKAHKFRILFCSSVLATDRLYDVSSCSIRNWIKKKGQTAGPGHILVFSTCMDTVSLKRVAVFAQFI